MIICVVERKGETHIVDYVSPNRKISTVCGKSLTHVFNTYAADNTFSGICKVCDSIYREMYEDDLNIDPAISRSNLLFKAIKKLTFIENQILTTESEYGNYVYKQWDKLFRIKRLLNRK